MGQPTPNSCFGAYLPGNIQAERDCGRCPDEVNCIEKSLEVELAKQSGKKFDAGKPQCSLLCDEAFMTIINAVDVQGTWTVSVIRVLLSAAHAETREALMKYVKSAIAITTAELGIMETISMMAEPMSYGIHKYGRNNWKGGMSWSRMLDAALRHFTAACIGIKYDEESDLPHISHGLASLNMLIGHISMNIGKNDLFPE